MGHHLILGRKTYQSIGSPLPGRTVIVLSRNPAFQPENGLKASSLQESFRLAQDAGEREVFVVGGAEIFSDALPVADHLYLTRVHATLEADRRFPTLDEEDWKLICKQFHPADDQNQYPHTFFHYIKSR
jgi:dihydrofolate reductase